MLILTRSPVGEGEKLFCLSSRRMIRREGKIFRKSQWLHLLEFLVVSSSWLALRIQNGRLHEDNQILLKFLIHVGSEEATGHGHITQNRYLVLDFLDIFLRND